MTLAGRLVRLEPLRPAHVAALLQAAAADLRNHRIRPDGSYRGSAVYSIIESEWASVKRGLVLRLEDASAARAEQ